MSNDQPTPPGRPGDPRRPHETGDEPAHPFFGRSDRAGHDGAGPARPAPEPPAPLAAEQPGPVGPAGHGVTADLFAEGGEFGSWFDDEPVRAPHLPGTPDRGTPVPDALGGFATPRRPEPAGGPEPARGYEQPRGYDEPRARQDAPGGYEQPRAPEAPGGYELPRPQQDSPRGYEAPRPEQDAPRGYELPRPEQDAPRGYELPRPEQDAPRGYELPRPQQDVPGGYEQPRAPESAGGYELPRPQQDVRGGYEQPRPQPDVPGGYEQPRAPESAGGYELPRPQQDSPRGYELPRPQQDVRGGYEQPRPQPDVPGGYGQPRAPEPSRGYELPRPQQDSPRGHEPPRPQQDGPRGYEPAHGFGEAPPYGNDPSGHGELPPVEDLLRGFGPAPGAPAADSRPARDLPGGPPRLPRRSPGMSAGRAAAAGPPSVPPAMPPVVPPQATAPGPGAQPPVGGPPPSVPPPSVPSPGTGLPPEGRHTAPPSSSAHMAAPHLPSPPRSPMDAGPAAGPGLPAGAGQPAPAQGPGGDPAPGTPYPTAELMVPGPLAAGRPGGPGGHNGPGASGGPAAPMPQDQLPPHSRPPGAQAGPGGEPGETGLPRRAGRRSLIGAFGAPAAPGAPAGPPPGGPGTPPAGGARPPHPGTMPGGGDNGDDGDGDDRTMTTRVTIKIPGSRPIPPVVLRGQAPMPVAGDAGMPAGPAPDGPDRSGYDTGGVEYGADDGVHDDRPASSRRESTHAAGRGTGPASGRPARRKGRRRLVLFSVAGFALLGGLYGASLAYAGGGVPRGTTVLGIGIGGQSPAEAVRTLDNRLGERALAPMPVRIGGKDMQLDPALAGLVLDTKATVDAAGTRSFNPLRSIPAMFGAGAKVEPRTTRDPVKTAAALDQLAAESGQQPREGGVTFAGGKAAAVAPQIVDVLDVPASVAIVNDAFLRERGTLVLPMTQFRPKVTQAEVDRALREFGVPAMSASVTLTAGGKQLRLTPQVLAKYLTMVPDDAGRLQPQIDTEGLQKEIGTTFSGVGERPQDATFKVVNGRVTVVPSKPGRGVSGKTAAAALLPALTKRDGRVARAELGPVEPKFTTADAEALGVTQVMSEYRTEYEPAAYRITNIHRAADLINGGVVQPGQMWSLNNTVGERTAENGFTKGTIINNGRFETDFGGGVSQVATTMWNAVFFAGLQDVQHKAHSFWIPRYPPGREATVVWGALDLRWNNDSGRPVYIQTEYTNTSITVRLFGTRKYDEIKSVSSAKYDIVKPKSQVVDTPGCVPQAASDGFRIDVTRVFIQDGREVKREKFPTKYEPADKIECVPAGTAPKPGGGTSSPSPSASPSATPTRRPAANG